MTGHPHTAESKAKISAANKGRVLTPEHRDKLSLAKQGKHLGFAVSHEAASEAGKRGGASTSIAKVAAARANAYAIVNTFEQLSAAGTAGTHSRWHVERGIHKPGCQLCENDAAQWLADLRVTSQ